MPLDSQQQEIGKDWAREMSRALQEEIDKEIIDSMIEKEKLRKRTRNDSCIDVIDV